MRENSAVFKKKRDYLVCLILAVISSFSFCIKNDVYVAPEKLSNKLVIILWQLKKAVQMPSYTSLAVLAAFFFAYCYLLPKLNRRIFKWSIPFAAVSAFVLLLCESYYKYDSWDKVFGGSSAFILSMIRGSGIAIPFFFCFQIINGFQMKLETHEGKEAAEWKRFLTIAGILMICWLPYILVMFPGNLNMDTEDEVAQALGNFEYCRTIKTIVPKDPNVLWNNHHPVFYTWILSVFIKLGDVIGSYAWGFEICGIVQCGLLAAVLAYFMIYAKHMGVSGRVWNCFMAFFALNPLLPLWGVTYSKDMPFSCAVLMVVLGLHRFLKSPEKLPLKSNVGLGIWILLLMLLRNNGFYMMLLMIPFAVILLRKNKRKLARLLGVALIPMLIFQIGIQNIMFPALHISKGSVREMLSIPFQQTARYVQEYGDTLGEEDEMNIRTVLGGGKLTLKEIGDCYVPDRSDSVKGKYNPEATNTDLKNYFRTWGSGLLEHPSLYIEAFLNMNYAWFSFDCNQGMHHYAGITGKNVDKMLEGVQNPEALKSARRIVKDSVEVLSRLPFLAWLIEFSSYTWMYLICLLVMLIRKKHQELVACCIIYANYLICFVGPVAYTRYALPMMVCAPFVLVLTFAKGENA